MNEKPRILIVEDDADLVAAMKRILENQRLSKQLLHTILMKGMKN